MLADYTFARLKINALVAGKKDTEMINARKESTGATES
jgi:hypothetical protein